MGNIGAIWSLATILSEIIERISVKIKEYQSISENDVKIRKYKENRRFLGEFTEIRTEIGNAAGGN